MRILGIDPGIQITGYCILDGEDDNYELVNCGSVRTDKNSPTCERLAEIFDDITSLCQKYKPDCASIEQVFFFKNQKTIIPVLEARGAILTALSKSGVEIFEYTPIVVKQVLTGSGRADKNTVRDMVSQYVQLDDKIKLDDTTDAVAIAICHRRNACLNYN